MKTGFVILNYNSYNLTSKLAAAVSAYRNIDLVVIVDNKSTDDSYEKLKKMRSSKITVASSERNGGYGYGNNYGAEICKKNQVDIMLIANPDVEVSEVDVDLILDSFEHEEYSLLAGVQYEIDGSVGQPVIWTRNNYADDLRECLILKSKKSNEGISLDESLKIQDIPVFKGSFFAVRLDDYLAVGGFDENVFLYCEERMLSKRLEDAGKKMGLVTAAKYHHMHSASVSKEYKKKADRIKILYKSRLYYQEKYLGIKKGKLIIMKSAMWLSLQKYKMIDFYLMKKSKHN